MHVVLANGQVYALNVWTFGYLETARAEARASGEYLGGAFMPAPDLFVEDLNRTHLEAVVADLIATGGLRGEWLVEKDDDDGK